MFKRKITIVRFIAANYPDRCIFANIKDFVADAEKPYARMKLVTL